MKSSANTMFKQGLIAVLALLLVSTPVSATAQTPGTYQPRTQQEFIAYLHGILSQLQSQASISTSVNSGRVLGVASGGKDFNIEAHTNFVQNTGESDTTLRGFANLKDAAFATAWFEYGEDIDDETTATQRITGSRSVDFSSRVSGLDERTLYYYRAVVEDPSGNREYGSTRSFFTQGDRKNSGGSSRDDDEPDARTSSAQEVDRDSAELRGNVDMNDFNNGIVFFVYGEDEDEVEDVEDEDQFSDIDEEGDDLQKERVDNDLDDDDSYEERVTGLDSNTDFFFRICVEYEDEDSDETLECGAVKEFDTDGSSRGDDTPDVTTLSARDIEDDEAEIRGEVDMNDFNNGLVFFVYGEDEDEIEDVEDEDEYSDIDEQGEDLQKFIVDRDLNDDATYTGQIFGLDDDTEHFFRICVAYEDEDDDETIDCGDVREFETDD